MSQKMKDLIAVSGMMIGSVIALILLAQFD